MIAPHQKQIGCRDHRHGDADVSETPGDSRRVKRRSVPAAEFAKDGAVANTAVTVSATPPMRKAPHSAPFFLIYQVP